MVDGCIELFVSLSRDGITSRSTAVGGVTGSPPSAGWAQCKAPSRMTLNAPPSPPPSAGWAQCKAPVDGPGADRGADGPCSGPPARTGGHSPGCQGGRSFLHTQGGGLFTVLSRRVWGGAFGPPARKGVIHRDVKVGSSHRGGAPGCTCMRRRVWGGCHFPGC